MKVRVLLRLLGIIALVVGATMLVPLACSAHYCFLSGELDDEARAVEWQALVAMLESIGIAIIVGVTLFFVGQTKKPDVRRREGLAVVGMGWLLAAALGAFPYLLSDTLPNYIDAYFESMSGFTTTGSTVLVSIEATARGLLFWRSFTQWLGGMGIVVLFVAIIPHLRASGKQLLYTEVPGPKSERLEPRIRDTAALLWKLYVFFSIVLMILLMVEGMGWFEAACHSFSTMSTGGFSPLNDSIGHYSRAGQGSPILMEVTIIVFMVIAGTNFGLYFRTLKGDRTAIFRDAEWRFYLTILTVAGALIVADLSFNGYLSAAGDITRNAAIGEDLPFGDALRASAFQVVSITTTTGFGTSDFDEWPHLSRAVMVVLFFVGGCAGSTGGGVKVIRILVIIKNALLATEHAIRPQTVRALRVGRMVVEPETRDTILAFFTIVMGTMVMGTLALCALGMDPVSALTSAATALNNIGPGLEAVGASESFATVPPGAKILLSLYMVVGRLEVFAILVLVSPRLWKSS